MAPKGSVAGAAGAAELEGAAASGAGAGRGEGRPVQARIERVMEFLIARHAANSEKAAAARQAYEGRRGKVHQDDELWEAWSSSFVEWLVVERVDEDGLVPAMRSLDELAARDPGDRDIAVALLRSHRSLFEVRQMGHGRVELLDLLGGGEYSVAEPRALMGVEVGDVAELRLCGIDDEVYFGRTFIYHPRAARGAIVEQASAMLAASSSRRDVIDRMAMLRVTLSRYRHVAAARVYEKTT